MSLLPSVGEAHDHLVAVGREARREGHAGEIAEHLLLAGVDVEEIDPRRAAAHRTDR